MLGNLFFFTLALTATSLLVLAAISFASFVIKSFYTLFRTVVMRKLSIYGYQCYYINYHSLEQDANCMRFLPILSELYTKGSRFSPFCVRLSEDRIPLNVMMNWSRSVAEDLFTATIPSVKLDQWNHYWKSKLYTRMTFFHSDFPEYEDNELGCLWGMVYMWLAFYFEKDVNDELMKRIVQVACKEKPAVPYFYHFYNSVREMLGEGLYLSSNSQGGDSFSSAKDFTLTKDDVFISAEMMYNGFEALSVAERCKARQVLNDVLADSLAWRNMRQEMRRRGWFKETIYPKEETNINISGDYILGDKVKEKTVMSGWPTEQQKGATKVLDKELLAQAIENCQQYFWANSSYAVVFCICRDVYKIPSNKSAFEKMVGKLPYHQDKKRSYSCPPGTIANAFSDNPIYNEQISEWENFEPLQRITTLRDKLLLELKL